MIAIALIFWEWEMMVLWKWKKIQNPQREKVPVWWLVKFWNPPENVSCKEQEKSNITEQDTSKTYGTLSSIPVTMFMTGQINLEDLRWRLLRSYRNHISYWTHDQSHWVKTTKKGTDWYLSIMQSGQNPLVSGKIEDNLRTRRDCSQINFY